jgi:hypothetical protein
LNYSRLEMDRKGSILKKCGEECEYKIKWQMIDGKE